MSIGDLLELSRRNEELEKKLAAAVEALKKIKHSQRPGVYDNDPFGIGIVSNEYRIARNALAEIEEIDAQKIRALEDSINHDHFNFQADE